MIVVGVPVATSSPGATRGLSASEAAAAAGVSLTVALAQTLTVDNLESIRPTAS